VKFLHEDIRKITGAGLMREIGVKKGHLDLLAGCPPCQGFSRMRNKNRGEAVDDPRNDLILEFLRLIKLLKPKSVMMENVPGLANDKKFKSFVKSLEGLGYKGDFKVLNAAHYGVPQRRYRLIYLAAKSSAPSPAPRVPGPEKTVRSAIGKLPIPGTGKDKLHNLPERRSKKVMKLIMRIPPDGGSRKDLPKTSQLKCHKNFDGYSDVYGRMSWGSVSPTITSGCFNPSKGRFLHPEQHRAITMREAALLQGFKKGYKFPTTGNKIAIALMIGNALPPPFVAAHAKRLIEAISVPARQELQTSARTKKA